ncbi:addiction module protein [Mucilaginibacter corticis]|uniref:Addiction module protein n=1 Tax=Mucilaginibacter corticis TaxID=2597670 RepID=A0A556MKA1_9SPHI|nr:addiction module protein [Mucilaginibacter corticis]TSJ40341.1 addiction module protein [Mucilaginibacter corticis]
MTTAVIREKLHDFIDIADEKKLEAIYSMIEDGVMENVGIWEDEEFLNELDRRMDELESGKVKGVTLEELKAKF